MQAARCSTTAVCTASEARAAGRMGNCGPRSLIPADDTMDAMTRRVMAAVEGISLTRSPGALVGISVGNAAAAAAAGLVTSRTASSAATAIDVITGAVGLGGIDKWWIAAVRQRRSKVTALLRTARVVGVGGDCWLCCLRYVTAGAAAAAQHERNPAINDRHHIELQGAYRYRSALKHGAKHVQSSWHIVLPALLLIVAAEGVILPD